MGNKIDLRGGEVTNEALEDEIIPIMNESKVRSPPLIAVRSRQPESLGSRDMRRMFGQATIERVRSLLLCTEGCVAPYGTTLRLKRSC